MITTAKTATRSKRSRAGSGRILTPNFDYFITGEEQDNSRERCRYRLLLEYACGQCLSPAEREAVMGHYRLGKSLTELSRQSGIPISTLSHRLRAAREKLFTFAEHAAAVQQILSDLPEGPLS